MQVMSLQCLHRLMYKNLDTAVWRAFTGVLKLTYEYFESFHQCDWIANQVLAPLFNKVRLRFYPGKGMTKHLSLSWSNV